MPVLSQLASDIAAAIAAPMRVNLPRLPALLARTAVAAAFPLAAAAAAQPVAPVQVQTAEQSLAEDAAHYAARYSVSAEEAKRRLRAQQESAAVTDRITRALAPRLAGVSIQHDPQYRLVVLLAGPEPVADQSALAAGSPVPVVFQTGAAATREQIVAAMRAHQPALRKELPNARGMGVDPRTGELVLLVNSADARRLGLPSIKARAEEVTGVPVRVELADPATNLLRGGALLVGIDAVTGKRYGCTTGFVVADGARTGIVTAAHCPDSLVYVSPDGRKVPLQFVGGWGVGYQDVQVHVGDGLADGPFFYADRRRALLRQVTGSRPRDSTRSGDFVCHWGEGSGHSCSEVELTDYAPPGDLCGGPCTPVWVTVKGPGCKPGDSGGPVFVGTTAFGILKGGSGISGRCNFYYYMPIDFLPDGWTLVTAAEAVPRR